MKKLILKILIGLGILGVASAAVFSGLNNNSKLTAHELKHLNAVKEEAQYLLKAENSVERGILLTNKEIDELKDTEYLNQIVDDVDTIIASGVFPVKYPSDIHDYLEEETKTSFIK